MRPKSLIYAPYGRPPSPPRIFALTIYMDPGKTDDDVPGFHKYFAEINLKYIMQSKLVVEGAVASWLVRSSPDCAVQVGALAGGHCILFLSKTLYCHSASLHPGV